LSNPFISLTLNDRVTITLPPWLWFLYHSLQDKEFEDKDEMINVAIDIASQNVAEKTGGPFGTAIFERDLTTGKSKLFCVGANRVTTLNNSTLHGEMVAIQFAQKKLKHYSLRQGSSAGTKEYILCTSCEPCAMCLGGTLWSGMHEMWCSATKDDAEAIGFNEGPVFPESYKQLEASGCKVTRNMMRTKGQKVLQKYAETGLIYNS
jgi:tRNA(Arg) A34 adenosine deaminase TadA